MKTKIYLSALSLVLVSGLTTSCDLDAPQQSAMDATNVYSIYSLAESEVMSICVSFGETNSYRGRYLPFYGMNTDVEVGSSNTPDGSKPTDDKQQLYNYGTLPTNGQMNTDNNAYAKFYEGIERANLAIQGLKEYGNISSNKDMGQLYGEALTLRAVLYNDLIKAWGDVPARFVPNNPTNIYLPRTNRDSIYKVLLADLKEAEGYCYWPKENTITSTTERISKSFVKGLRARLALYACGYGLRGDGYRRSKDADLSQDKMMEIVKDECLGIINSGKNILGGFEQNFKNLCEENTAAGGESLYEIPFSEGRGRVLYTFGIKHNSNDQYTKQPQGGVNGPMPYLYYDYDKEDARRDITCIPYEWSKELKDGKSWQQLRNINKWCFGKLRYEWMKRTVTSTNDDGINWQYMRLADVYLMAAEAINYLDGPAAAWPYMKPVLDRVLPAEKIAELKAKYTASKDAFQEGIVDQRGFEFAGESLRKADLVRWGIIDEKMAEAKQKLSEMSTHSGRYADLPNKLYYQLQPDGETLKIYGLEHGDTDAHGKELTNSTEELADGAIGKWQSKSWFYNETNGTYGILQTYIDGVYFKQPSLNCLWPIWEKFLQSSNGLINNEGNYGQLSN